MSYIKPEIPLINNPINLDAAIQKLQIALGQVNWLERVYGRASTGIIKQASSGNREYKFPEVYIGEGNYLILEPNNYLSAHAFFKVETAQEAPEYKPFILNRFQQRVSIIIWANLDKIKERSPLINFGHRFTEELKADVLNVLRYSGDYVVQRIHENPLDVFAGYSLNHAENQTFKHPEAGFKIEGLLHFTENC